MSVKFESNCEQIYTPLCKINNNNHHHVTTIPLGSPNEKQDHSRGRFESWSGKAMEGRVLRVPGSTANTMRGYWERNIEMEQRAKAEAERRQRPKSYGFPKWRSTDALSASLVASNSIQIPVDSRIPEDRLRKMQQTEQEAMEVKKEIHEESKKLSKGKSMESLMQSEQKPWYDADKIKAAVSRESIANIASSREFFENASTRDWRHSRNNSVCSLNTIKNEPPRAKPAIDPNYYIDSPQSIDPIEQQEVLLMLYLKQNMDIAQGLGIIIPDDIIAEMNDLQTLPVELRISDNDSMFSPRQNNNNRYQRKPQTFNNPSNRFGVKCNTKRNELNNYSNSNNNHQSMDLSQSYYTSTTSLSTTSHDPVYNYQRR